MSVLTGKQTTRENSYKVGMAWALEQILYCHQHRQFAKSLQINTFWH